MRLALASLAFGLMIASAPVHAGPKTTIGMMADTPANFDVVLRLSSGLDHQGGLRILPIAGKGPLQTLNDLVYLKGIDAALLPSDVLAYARANGLITIANEKLSYLVKLGQLDVHLLASKDINSLQDLAGKRVAIGTSVESSYITGHFLMQAAGIAFEEIPLGGSAAIKAVAEGQADAALLLGVEPLSELSGVKSRNLHLVSLQAPAEAADVYAPALISHEDYPSLLKKGETIETLSTAVIVAVFEWPRGSPQGNVSAALADGLYRVLQPDDTQSAGINFTAQVPGWQRARVAEDVLKKRAARATQSQLATTEN